MPQNICLSALRILYDWLPFVNSNAAILIEKCDNLSLKKEKKPFEGFFSWKISLEVDPRIIGPDLCEHAAVEQ